MIKKAQKISSYFAIFKPTKEGGYNVSFPDFPGCVTFGRTFEEGHSQDVPEHFWDDSELLEY